METTIALGTSVVTMDQHVHLLPMISSRAPRPRAQIAPLDPDPNQVRRLTSLAMHQKKLRRIAVTKVWMNLVVWRLDAAGRRKVVAVTNLGASMP
jgi:hypothetical protein